MKFSYPIKLTADPEGGYIARAVDIPEALTFGRDKEAALHEAGDAVHVALTAYIEDGQAIPPPSPPRGRPAITLPALVAAKLAPCIRPCGTADRAMPRWPANSA